MLTDVSVIVTETKESTKADKGKEKWLKEE